MRLGDYAVCSILLGSACFAESPGVGPDDGNATQGDGGTAVVTVGTDDPSAGTVADASSSGDGADDTTGTTEPCLPGTQGCGCTDADACEASLACVEEVCVSPFCGNGRPDADEACDDGNTLPGDGCSPTCTVENRCLIANLGGPPPSSEVASYGITTAGNLAFVDDSTVPGAMEPNPFVYVTGQTMAVGRRVYAIDGDEITARIVELDGTFGGTDSTITIPGLRAIFRVPLRPYALSFYEEGGTLFVTGIGVQPSGALDVPADLAGHSIGAAADAVHVRVGIHGALPLAYVAFDPPGPSTNIAMRVVPLGLAGPDEPVDVLNLNNAYGNVRRVVHHPGLNQLVFSGVLFSPAAEASCVGTMNTDADGRPTGSTLVQMCAGNDDGAWLTTGSVMPTATGLLLGRTNDNAVAGADSLEAGAPTMSVATVAGGFHLLLRPFADILVAGGREEIAAFTVDAAGEIAAPAGNVALATNGLPTHGNNDYFQQLVALPCPDFAF